MKKLSVVFMLLCSILSFQGCNDGIPLEDVEIKIKYKVTCQNPDAQMHVRANGLGPKGVSFKGILENEVYTKNNTAVIDAHCDDPKALITVDLYIGKKHFREVGNSPVHVSERLKGKDPYLE